MNKLTSCRVLVSLVFVVIVCVNCDKDRERTKIKSHIDSPDEERHRTEDGEHNPEYDAEMFLGRDRATLFKELPPEETRDRLRDILRQVDTDHDKIITERELDEWLRKIDNERLTEDAATVLKEMDEDNSGTIDFKELSKHTYGDTADADAERSEELNNYLQREKKKFALADIDDSGDLSLAEFVTFQHPERHQHLTDVVVTDVLNEIDKNGDSYVQFEEMVGEENLRDGEGQEWIAEERKEFGRFDKDGDGKLSTIEMKEWILPDKKYIDEEVKHLLEEIDENKDGRITISEALKNYKLLAGSKITDYGNLNLIHDEM